jgi:hypothetical protein
MTLLEYKWKGVGDDYGQFDLSHEDLSFNIYRKDGSVRFRNTIMVRFENGNTVYYVQGWERWTSMNMQVLADSIILDSMFRHLYDVWTAGPLMCHMVTRKDIHREWNRHHRLWMRCLRLIQRHLVQMGMRSYMETILLLFKARRYDDMMHFVIEEPCWERHERTVVRTNLVLLAYSTPLSGDILHTLQDYLL